MKTLRICVSLAALVALVIGSIAVATGSLAITAPESIKLTGHPTFGKFIDVDGEGFTPGDYNIFSDRLTTRTSNATVGYTRVRCLFFPDEGLCEAAAIIHGRGQIMVHGFVVHDGGDPTNPVSSEWFGVAARNPAVFSLPIVGGTGDFANARGFVSILPKRDGTTAYHVHLLP